MVTGQSVPRTSVDALWLLPTDRLRTAPTLIGRMVKTNALGWAYRSPERHRSHNASSVSRPPYLTAFTLPVPRREIALDTHLERRPVSRRRDGRAPPAERGPGMEGLDGRGRVEDG